MLGSNKVDISGKGTVDLSAGFLRLRWQPGVSIGFDDANSAFSAISALGKGAKLPLLVDIHDVTHSSAARKIFPDPASVSRVALVGSSPWTR
ncbi:hypothetical protein [Arthrobacter sedimenti]|uniref:Uncharacterized protein n=1 Tax=Arthrobacter sedimenti TaxID=2694931 RepID=A0ABV8WSN9_9MICC